MRLGSKKNKKTVVGKLRKSQIITTFGVGSIVSQPDCSVIMAAIDYWDIKKKLYEPNLQRLLNVRYFVEPKATKTRGYEAYPDIPAFRFPMIHYCPQCNRLMSYKEFGDTNGKKCIECGKELIPSRFVIACGNGHLEDFPYKWWVHNGDYSNCNAFDKYDKLTIEFSNIYGGLKSIKIKCTACGAERTMEGCMDNDALKGYKCKGHRPWIGRRRENYDPIECNARMRTLQRGASNVYFGITQSALTIPPWSKPIRIIIEEKWNEIDNFMKVVIDDDMLTKFIESIFLNEIENKICNVSDLVKEVKKIRIEESYRDEKFDENNLFEDEYKALSDAYDGGSEENFKTIKTEVPKDFKKYFSDIVLVKRLREVFVLKGFRRIMPEKPDENDFRSIGLSDRDYVSLSDEKLNWLPAIEMLGEGIFIRFDENKLRDWEERMSYRYDSMKKNLKDSNICCNKFSTRYVLLHTFSHLLIRELTNKCGYSESALKERIYSTYKSSNFDMAGVLIYTSTSDSDGSLGGLVRQAESEELNNTILNLLQNATWCSSDPLCIESKQQGYNSLNYAACHACALLPETCCEARNCFLDRVAVVGKMEDRSMGYFRGILE